MENIADLAQIKNIMNPLESTVFSFLVNLYSIQGAYLHCFFWIYIVPNYSGTNDPGGLIFLYRTGLKTTRKRGA